MLQQLLKSTIGLSRTNKGMLIAGVDIILIFVSIWAAFSLRFDEFYIPPAHLLWIFVLAPLVAIPIFLKFGLYHAIIRYIGFQALWAVAKAVSLYCLIWSAIVLLSGVEVVPRTF